MEATHDTRQRILDSARDLIYASSYADVGVAAICDHAGVKKGSFYHFFPSKQELALAMVDAFYLDMKEKLVSKAFTQDLPPLARLERFCTLAYEFQINMQQSTGMVLGCPFGNLANEVSTQDEQLRVRLEQIFSNLRGLIQQTLQDAQDHGDLQDIDPAATARAMLAYFEGVMLMAKSQNSTEVIKQLLPAISAIRIHAEK